MGSCLAEFRDGEEGIQTKKKVKPSKLVDLLLSRYSLFHRGIDMSGRSAAGHSHHVSTGGGRGGSTDERILVVLWAGWNFGRGGEGFLGGEQRPVNILLGLVQNAP